MITQQNLSHLIVAIKQDDERAFSLLLEQFEPLIVASASRFCSPPAYVESDFEDLRQEAVLALYNAAKSYDEAFDGVTFGLYAKICIKNRLISAKRQKLRKLRSGGKKVGRPRKDLKNPPQPAPEKHPKSSFMGTVPTDSQLHHFLALAEQDLTTLEKKAFDLYLAGSSYREIGEELHCDFKSVDNALTRAKKKLKKYAQATQED